MDTGYSWVILAGACLNYFIIVGNLKTSGLLYAELLDYFKKDSATTSLYVTFIRLFSSFTGPIASYICVAYSFRAVSFVGAILIGVGFISSAFVRSPEMFFLTYSTIVGIGFGLILSAPIGIISLNFSKHRSLATGLVTAAGGFSAVALSPLFRYAFDTYGLHGGLLLLGGIFLNTCVGSSTYRQPNISLVDNENLEPNKSSLILATFQFLKRLYHSYKTIVKSPGFILYTIAFSFALLGYVTIYIILPPHLQSRGVSKNVIVLIIMTTGGTEVISRIVFGRIIDMKYMKPDAIFLVNLGIGGVMSIAFPFFNSVPLYFTYMIIMGFFPGSMFTYLPAIIIPVCGLKLLTQAVALYSLINNAFLLGGVPLIGLLEDLTGNWNISFRVLGGAHILSSLLVLVWRICNNRLVKKTNALVNINGDVQGVEYDHTTANINGDVQGFEIDHTTETIDELTYM